MIDGHDFALVRRAAGADALDDLARDGLDFVSRHLSRQVGSQDRQLGFFFVGEVLAVGLGVHVDAVAALLDFPADHVEHAASSSSTRAAAAFAPSGGISALRMAVIRRRKGGLARLLAGTHGVAQISVELVLELIIPRIERRGSAAYAAALRLLRRLAAAFFLRRMLGFS